MKKKLLLAAFAMVSTLGAFAQKNIGDYVFTATQKVKILGENLVKNGNFAEGTDGWTDAAGEALNTEVWSVEAGVGPNGENVLQSMNGGTAEAALCGKWAITESGGYVVMFDIKGDTYTPTYQSVGVNNSIDFWFSADANDNEFNRKMDRRNDPKQGLVPFDDGTIDIATTSGYNDEWKTIAFFALGENGKNILMRMERLSQNTQITNIQIYKAQEVFDSRILDSKLAFVDKLIATGKFQQDTENGFIDNVVGTIRGMKEDPSSLDNKNEVEGLLASYDEELVAWFNANGADMLKDEKRWSTYGDTRKMDGIGGNWKGTGGRWFHMNNGGSNVITNDGDEIGHRLQGGMAAGAASQYYTITPKTAGTYMFSLDVTGYYMMGSASAMDVLTGVGTNYLPDFYREFKGVTMFAGKDVLGGDAAANETLDAEQEGQKIDCGAINNPNAKQNCQKFVVFYEVSQADVDAKTPINFGITYIPTDAPNKLGSNVNIANPQILLIGETQDEADYKNEVAAIIVQQGPLKERLDWAREDLQKTAVDGYPWGKGDLQAKIEEIQPTYDESLTVIDAEGNVLNEALIREYLANKKVDAAAQLYSEVLLQAVKDMNSARTAYSNTNKPIRDYRSQVSGAESVLADPMYGAGDKATFQGVINETVAMLDQILAVTTDDTRDADIETMNAQLAVLAEAIVAFKESATLQPIIDIDFSNGFSTDEEDNDIIKGAKGVMVFDSGVANPTQNVVITNEEKGIGEMSYALGVNSELLDVLRVGNGKAWVNIDEADQPAADDILRFEFDMWLLRLTDGYITIDLLNAADQRVAGFSYCSYTETVAYNDFNNEAGEGMPLNKNVAVANTTGDAGSCADNNKTSFNLLLNYRTAKAQGIVISPTATNTGAPVPFRTAVDESTPLEDTKVVKFQLSSNYKNYPGRRCWFDNLKVYKYKAGEEDGIANVAVENAANADAIYTLSGVKVAKAQKGFYIQNGKKFVVK